jgi:hypothetical protein
MTMGTIGIAGAGSTSTVGIERASLAVISLATAAIHFAVMSAHFGEHFAFGLFFAVVAWLQSLWAVGVVASASRKLLWVGAIVNAAVVIVWIVSRTSGLPIGPEAGTPEPPAFADVLSTILELALVVGAGLLLVLEAPRAVARTRTAAAIVVALAASLAVLTTLAIVQSGGGEGTDHGGSEMVPAAVDEMPP